jgi:4-hydroxybenzoate polyprenyltransferase
VSVPERAPEVVPLVPRRTPAQALAALLRPRQWVKNLFVLAGIVFAAKLGDPTRWALALTAFVAYCAASSAAYVVNDLRDAPADRLHPLKRRRPLARGEVSTRAALTLAAALLAVALVLGAALGLVSLACLLAFVVLQVAYTWWLKELVLVDAFAIAGLFVLRAAAGALAIDVPVSTWLLLCSGLLALFLALGKRRAELELVRRFATPGRAVLSGYSLELVDQLLTVTAAATIAAYAGYAVAAHDTAVFAATVPLVVLGLFRYLALLREGVVGEEPDVVLLSDRPLLGILASWAVLCAILLALE